MKLIRTVFRPPGSFRCRQAGVTLIEALIAACVASFGLMAVVLALFFFSSLASEVLNQGYASQYGALDGLVRAEMDQYGSMKVFADRAATDSVTVGPVIRFGNPPASGVEFWWDPVGLSLNCQRDSQSASALIPSGVSNVVFDVSSGALRVILDGAGGRFEGTYEIWRH